MSRNFDLEDVLAAERIVLAGLPESTPTVKVYFREDVAQVLYEAWVKDNTDMRLLTYCFPLIQAMMVKNIYTLKRSRLEEGEIFNTLCLSLLAAFPKYNPTRGRLFTFFTLMLHFRIKDVCRPRRDDNTDPLDDWDMPVEDDAFHLLEDFKAFLFKLAIEQGPTASRMLRAFVEILTDHRASIEYGRSQDRIKAGIARKTTLPRAIVDPFYASLLTRWAHSVLD